MSLQMRDQGTAARYVEVQLVLEQSENDLILNQCWLNGLLILQKNNSKKLYETTNQNLTPRIWCFFRIFAVFLIRLTESRRR